MSPFDVKHCSKCGLDKPRAAFSLNSAASDGLQGWCKSCMAAYSKEDRKTNPSKWRDRGRQWRDANKDRIWARYLKRTYGLSVEEFDAMWNEQEGCCHLCSAPLERRPGGFATDHSHATGRVRKILCAQCNSGIGYLKDDPALMRRAADYVEAHALLEFAV